MQVWRLQKNQCWIALQLHDLSSFLGVPTQMCNLHCSYLIAEKSSFTTNSLKQFDCFTVCVSLVFSNCYEDNQRNTLNDFLPDVCRGPEGFNGKAGLLLGGVFADGGSDRGCWPSGWQSVELVTSLLVVWSSRTLSSSRSASTAKHSPKRTEHNYQHSCNHRVLRQVQTTQWQYVGLSTNINWTYDTVNINTIHTPTTTHFIVTMITK